MKSILTPYFTKDESTFNPRSLENVLNQAGVEQKIYGVRFPNRLEAAWLQHRKHCSANEAFVVCPCKNGGFHLMRC